MFLVKCATNNMKISVKRTQNLRTYNYFIVLFNTNKVVIDKSYFIRMRYKFRPDNALFVVLIFFDKISVKQEGPKNLYSKYEHDFYQ